MNAGVGSEDVGPGAVAAALLAQGATIDALSRLLTAAAAVGLMAGAALPIRLSPSGAGMLTLVALAGLGELYWSVRVRFDAALFAAGDADRALVALGLLPEAKSGRPIAARIAGAKRLLLRQALALLAQIVLIGLGGIWAAAGGAGR